MVVNIYIRINHIIVLYCCYRCRGSENKSSQFSQLQGEEYKLMWPEKPEFVRAAAKFGAKIIPFCGVGEDDFLKVSTITFYSSAQPCALLIYSWCD